VSLRITHWVGHGYHTPIYVDGKMARQLGFSLNPHVEISKVECGQTTFWLNLNLEILPACLSTYTTSCIYFLEAYLTFTYVHVICLPDWLLNPTFVNWVRPYQPIDSAKNRGADYRYSYFTYRTFHYSVGYQSTLPYWSPIALARQIRGDTLWTPYLAVQTHLKT